MGGDLVEVRDAGRAERVALGDQAARCTMVKVRTVAALESRRCRRPA
jgi:hypothetical protein